jgi:hydroxymethylbilane synthase
VLNKKSNALIIGSRQSDLARLQAIIVADHLKQKSSIQDIQFYNRPSFGDLNLDMNLKETNSKGVFTHEFQELLKNRTCDLVVHSWKDLPIEDHPDTEILTLSHREDQRDLLFLKKDSFGLNSLKFLTSSPRREYHLNKNLKSLLPFDCESFKFEAIRGNIPTRFLKFLKSDADGFVVAKAAVDRLMGTDHGPNHDEFSLVRSQIMDVFENCDWMVLPLSEFPTAAAQGALAIEILKSHPFLEELRTLSDSKVFDLVNLERKTHKKYGGGCHQAMGFSALPTNFGSVFYASGEFEGDGFEYRKFNPNRKLKKQYTEDQLFSQTELSSSRSKHIYSFSDLESEEKSSANTFEKRSEFVITRYEAKLEDLKSKDFTVWASGAQTWKKLAKDGYWINGSLDGLGVMNKPQLEYLNPTQHIWLSNSSSPEEGTGSFKLIPTYDLQYELDGAEVREYLKDKECFLWMSGHCFESVLKVYPELKNKIHFCGLGRTVDTLKKHLNDEQIYFCLNEEDFVKQSLG